MTNFVFIPVIALCCYLLLLFAFIAARKTKLNDAFILVLVCGVLWMSGSFCMRMQFWPGEKLWYDISIFGLLMMPFAFFCFVQEFVGARKSRLQHVWLILSLGINIINICTGFFLKAPESTALADGRIRFVYDITWSVSILFIVCGAVLIHMFMLLFKSYKTDEIRKRQLMPIMAGIVSIFFGTSLSLFPHIQRIPNRCTVGGRYGMFYVLRNVQEAFIQADASGFQGQLLCGCGCTGYFDFR